jgi:hypothetical protein
MHFASRVVIVILRRRRWGVIEVELLLGLLGGLARGIRAIRAAASIELVTATTPEAAGVTHGDHRL